MATKRAKVNKTLEKAKKLVSKKGKKKVTKRSYPEGQNAPQSKAYDMENDKTVPAKRVGYRFTKEGAKKLSKKPNDRPTEAEIDKYRNQTFKVKGKVNKSGPKGVGDGSFRYLYIESRADKSDLNKARKLELGGETPDEVLRLYVYVDVYEDDYKLGEGDAVQTYMVDSLPNPTVKAKYLVRYLSNHLYLSDNPNDYSINDDGIIYTDQLQDSDGSPASKGQIEKWKEGKEKLYNARYTIVVEAIKERNPSVEELAQATGIGTYAKGGEMFIDLKSGDFRNQILFDPKEVREFEKYVFSWYGKNGVAVDDMEENIPATTAEVLKAVSQYLAFCNKTNKWGGGDSFDREVVHDIIAYNRNPKTTALFYENLIKDMKKTPILEYGGILQPMIGGVNADPRFDIYNTTMFAEKGAEVPHGEKEQVKFFEIVNEIKNLEYDGDPKDRRLHSESRFYWGANNEDDYDEATKQINQIGIKGKGWEIYATYDVSGYDYWMKTTREPNYIHIVVSFDKQTVHEDEIGKIESALYEAIMDAERISNAFDYDPSTSDDDEYAKGGKLSDTFKEAYDYGDREGYIRDFGSVELEVKGKDKEIKLVALAKIMNIYDATGDEQFEKTPYEVTFEIVPSLKDIDKKHIKSAMDSSGIDELSSINYGDIFESYMSGVPLRVDGETFKLFATYDEAKDYIYSKEVNDDITVSSRLVGFALDRPVNRIGTTGWSYLTAILDKNHDPYKFAKGGATDDFFQLLQSKKERVIDYYLNNDIFDDPETYGVSEEDLKDAKKKNDFSKLEKAIIKYHGLNDPSNVEERFELLGLDDEYAKGGKTESRKFEFQAFFYDCAGKLITSEYYVDAPSDKEVFELAKKLGAKTGQLYRINYDTGEFIELVADYDCIDEYAKGGETKIYEVATRTKGKSGQFASSVRAKSKEDALRIYKEKHGDDKNKVIVDVYETTRKRLEDGGMANGKHYVGRFTEAQLKNKEDEKAIEKAQKETGLKYIDTKMVKKAGKIVAMDVYLIDLETYLKQPLMAKGGEITKATLKKREIKKINQLIEEYAHKGESIEFYEPFKINVNDADYLVTDVMEDGLYVTDSEGYDGGMPLSKLTFFQLQKVTSQIMDNIGEMAKGGKTHEQGYDDREDERLAMRHGKIASKDFVGSHKRREHSRRDDARFETRNK